MIPTTPVGVADHAPTPPGSTALDALAAELRALYQGTYQLALKAAETARNRFETPDGTGQVDPVYAADTAACRAVNAHMAEVVGRWLPNATRLHGIDEPAVIDSWWLHQQRVIAIEFDYGADFGDPDALIVREVGR